MSQNSPETDDADTGTLFLLILPMSFGQEKQTVSFNGMISAFLSKFVLQICSSSHFSSAYNYLLVLLLERKIMARKGLWGQKRADLLYLSMHSCECNDDKMEC